MNGFFDLLITWSELLLSCVEQGRGLPERGAVVRFLRGKKPSVREQQSHMLVRYRKYTAIDKNLSA